MHMEALRGDIYADVGGADHFQDGGHGGHFGFSKIIKCVVIWPKNMHTKFDVDWCSSVSRIGETKV